MRMNCFEDRLHRVLRRLDSAIWKYYFVIAATRDSYIIYWFTCWARCVLRGCDLDWNSFKLKLTWTSNAWRCLKWFDSQSDSYIFLEPTTNCINDFIAHRIWNIVFFFFLGNVDDSNWATMSDKKLKPHFHNTNYNYTQYSARATICPLTIDDCLKIAIMNHNCDRWHNE